MKNLKSQSLTSLILILACLLGGYFVVFANFQKLNQTRARLARAETDKKNLDQSLQQLQSFLDKYHTLGNEARIAGLALPTKPQTALLLGDLESLAKLSGVALATVNFIESPDLELQKLPANSIVPMEVQISFSGSFISFRDFIDRLEKHIRLLDVQLVSIGAEDQSQNYKYDLRFKIYYQK